MATQDFALSYTVEVPALFNEEKKQGAAGTIFTSELANFSKQGAAGTIFAGLAVLDKNGPETEMFDLSDLCANRNELSGPLTSQLSGPLRNIFGC